MAIGALGRTPGAVTGLFQEGGPCQQHLDGFNQVGCPEQASWEWSSTPSLQPLQAEKAAIHGK